MWKKGESIESAPTGLRVPSASQKNKILQQLKLVLKDEPDIVLAILFGSCAKGTATFNSDIDIAIKLNKPLNLLQNSKFF